VTPQRIRLRKPGLLLTTSQFGNHVLKVDFRAAKGTNSGDRSQPADCGTGGIFRRQNARKVVANDREWFAKTIHADGPHVAVWVNGYQVSDWTDRRAPAENPRKGLRLKAGTIIFQAHDPTADFFFRNLRIAELAAPAR
jgi:hypothetical protein